MGTKNYSLYKKHTSVSFTLVELITVSTILMIVVGITVPQYMKAIEKSKAKGVSSTLKLIFSAQQRYKLDNGEYFSCIGQCQPKEVYDALGITLATINSFSYFIEKTGDATNPGFIATAKRKSEGPCKDLSMSIKNDREATETEIIKGCSIW